MSAAAGRSMPRCVLITGGAGFVGTNLAARLLERGVRVRVLDSLSRPGVETNLRWLEANHGERLEAAICDVRDESAVRSAMRDVEHVYHLAAQVAVTSSLSDPRHDFAINAAGTLNVLEAARACVRPPSIMFASTNKVYGALQGVRVRPYRQRYVPVDVRIAARGLDERSPLEFHSPYGCSKGAAEQYVLDYARSFGLRTVVLRMSCIYGPHQHGNEDQGWVAHFLRRALDGQQVTLYGTGMQVRDVLYVEDFVTALEAVASRANELSGEVFNIGGGVRNTVSLLELVALIERLTGLSIETRYDDWRTGDQRYYVSNVEKIARATGWRPHTPVEKGVAALYHWLRGEQRTTRVAAARPQELRP